MGDGRESEEQPTERAIRELGNHISQIIGSFKRFTDYQNKQQQEFLADQGRQARQTALWAMIAAISAAVATVVLAVVAVLDYVRPDACP